MIYEIKITDQADNDIRNIYMNILPTNCSHLRMPMVNWTELKSVL